MKKAIVSLVALCLCSLTAFADQADPMPRVTLTFEQIKAACLNPAQFQNQVAPTNIQISCKDIQTKWIPEADGTLTLKNSRQVTAAVMSDKYSAEPCSGAVAIEAQAGTCTRFKKVKETMSTVRAVTCDELTSYKGSAIEFCSEVINEMRASNPAAVVTSATTLVADFCPQGPKK